MVSGTIARYKYRIFLDFFMGMMMIIILRDHYYRLLKLAAVVAFHLFLLTLSLILFSDFSKKVFSS